MHTSRNSSEVINGVIIKTNSVVSQVLLPTLTFVSSIIIMIGIVNIVFTIDAQVALITFLIFRVLLVDPLLLRRNTL